MPIQLLFVALAVFFAQSALAQQFYQWQDEKGQWHYSDFRWNPSIAPDISPLTFAEYRGQIVGLAGGSDRWVETEAKWSKD